MLKKDNPQIIRSTLIYLTNKFYDKYLTGGNVG